MSDHAPGARDRSRNQHRVCRGRQTCSLPSQRAMVTAPGPPTRGAELRAQRQTEKELSVDSDELKAQLAEAAAQTDTH